MFDKAQLVNLRNLSLALHASAGHLITIPTDSAIVGEADQDTIRVAMMALINPIMQDIVNISKALNEPMSTLQVMLEKSIGAV